MRRRTRTLDEILQRTVACPETGCWIWEGSTTGEEAPTKRGRNRPKIYWLGHYRIVTRVVMELITGKRLPATIHVDHVKNMGCRSILCIRPEHLEPVTGLENARRRYT